MGNTVASDDSSYKDGDGLYSTVEKTVHDKLKALSNNRSNGVRVLVVINNESKFPVERKNHGGKQSFFYTNIAHGFKSDTIESKHCGGFMLIRDSGIPIYGIVGGEHATGYISLSCKTPGRNYVIVLGFQRVQWGRNKAGIAIRGEDGKSDEFGNVNGHGTDPTGTVTDINQLCSTEFTAASKDLHSFFEKCAYFKVECSFPDGHHPDRPFTWTFTIKDL